MADRRGATRAALVSGEQGQRLAHGFNAPLTPTAWLPPRDLDISEWAAQGQRLGTIGRATGWWIGDWLRYGNLKFGERYARAARMTGYDVQTLMNMVCVASTYEPSERREGLSWSHHAELTALPPADRRHWLDLAESNRMSVRCLREAVARKRRLSVLEASASTKAARALQAQPEPAVVCPQCGCHIAAGDGDPRGA